MERKSSVVIIAQAARLTMYIPFKQVRTTLLSTRGREVSFATKTGTGSDEVCVGFPYDNPNPTFTKSADHFSELEGHSSKAPGMRAEGRPSMIPAAVLRPPQMLDSTPVGDKSGSKSSFVEHMSEMEDTVSVLYDCSDEGDADADVVSTIASYCRYATVSFNNGLACARSSSWSVNHFSCE